MLVGGEYKEAEIAFHEPPLDSNISLAGTEVVNSQANFSRLRGKREHHAQYFGGS
jgi:hypothetical protein